MTDSGYDAILVASHGGPEGPDDVLPFLENVVRGKNVPRPRLLEVAKHYELFDGVSPANAQIRALLAALLNELSAAGHDLSVYWGNRCWHPLLGEAIGQMAGDGVRRALVFVTSAYSSYPACRQYLEDIERARHEVGPDAPQIDKLRVFYNHPGFIEPMAERVEAALREVPPDGRGAAHLIFTAHSLPTAMAEKCAYGQQLRETCRLVCECIGRPQWQLVYQSRSGPPSQPWLEPDVSDALRDLARHNPGADVVIVPIGFLYEHTEIVYDLDVQARALCDQLGLNMVRSAVVGCHRRFVRMIRELIEERLTDDPTRQALGPLGPGHDVCSADCCR